MPTSEELYAQIEALKIQAEEARKAEKSGAVAEIRAMMAKYGVTMDDLGGKGGKTAKRGSVAAKYRDPVSGKTWTGRGRRPAWVADLEAQGKNLDDFRA